MQAGEISERDYWAERMRETGALVGEEWKSFPEFIGRVRWRTTGSPVIRPEALEAIAQASADGHTLAILSNELRSVLRKGLPRKLPFLSDFAVIIDPPIRDSEARSASLQFSDGSLDIKAEDCVFVDDQQKNLGGAEAVGMPYVHFDVTDPGTSYAQALKMLNAE